MGYSYGKPLERIEIFWLVELLSQLVMNRVRFWKDKWCSDEPLCTTFPSLFAIVASEEAWVVDV